jgi:hypothetical protein
MRQDDGIGVVASRDLRRSPGGRARGWHAGLVVAHRVRPVVDSVGEPVAKVAEVSPA